MRPRALLPVFDAIGSLARTMLPPTRRASSWRACQAAPPQRTRRCLAGGACLSPAIPSRPMVRGSVGQQTEPVPQETDLIKIPRALLERFTDALCYAA